VKWLHNQCRFACFRFPLGGVGERRSDRSRSFGALQITSSQWLQEGPVPPPQRATVFLRQRTLPGGALLSWWCLLSTLRKDASCGSTLNSGVISPRCARKSYLMSSPILILHECIGRFGGAQSSVYPLRPPLRHEVILATKCIPALSGIHIML